MPTSLLSLLLLPLFLAFVPLAGIYSQQRGAQDSAEGLSAAPARTEQPFLVRVPVRERALAGSGRTFTAAWRPKIGLVLSGGGARGLAQIGVIRALEEAGIRPDFIVGTSIGSIIGGLYASGYNARRLERAIRGIDWGQALRLSDAADRSSLSVEQKTISDRSILTLRFDGLQPILPQAVSNGQRLTNLLNELTLQGVYHANDFDDLGIPFRAIATDLVSGRRVVLGDGSLAESMRASSTVPVMYAAVSRDSMLLVDGGLLSNIACDVAVDAGCDFIIAVNTTSSMRRPDELGTALEIIDQVFNVVMIPQNDEQLALADAVITPDLGSMSGTDFTQVDSLIRIGYESSLRMAAELRRKLVAAATERMPRPSPALASYDLRPRMSDQDDDPWFSGRHALDEIYGKAVMLAEDGRYTNVEVELRAWDGSAVINASSAAQLTDVSIHGNKLLSNAALVGIQTRWKRQPVTAEFEKELSEYILEDYRQHGYSLAHIDSLRISDDGRASVYINEGIVGRISVTGNTRTNEVVILREIPLREGEVFRMADMKRGMENLLALNLFHHVAYDIQTDETRAHLVIRVVERPSQELQTGLLVDNERNAQIGLLLRDANFLGTGTEISGSFFTGQSNREYRLAYSTNRMFYTPFSARIEGYYGFRDYNNYIDVQDLPSNRFDREPDLVYRNIGYGTSAAFGLDVQRFGKLLGTLRFEQQRIRTDQLRIPDAEPIEEEHLLVALSLSSTVDTQDRYPYPRKGLRFNAEYTSSQTALGSEVAFTRLTAGYDFYIPMIPDVLVIHPRLLFGYGDKTMPRTEEFRIGGLSSFMGMRENEYVGRQIALASLELRYTLPLRIFFDTYFSARYDLGRTWSNPELIKINELRHGVGFQLGLDTPIGPADFGIGRSFYFQSSSADIPVRLGAVNLYFSIGAKL